MGATILMYDDYDSQEDLKCRFDRHCRQRKSWSPLYEGLHHLHLPQRRDMEKLSPDISTRFLVGQCVLNLDINLKEKQIPSFADRQMAVVTSDSHASNPKRF